MEDYRLKIKVGEHEFDAVGPVDVVRDQFLIWKELIASLPTPVAASTVVEPQQPRVDPAVTNPNDPNTIDAALGRIMRADGRVVSLTAPPRSVSDAVLLIVYGQKVMRSNDAVTGSEVMDGLTASGPTPPRVDRLLAKAGTDGDIILLGTGRSKRYRLTNVGITKARALASGLIASVA